MVVLALAEPVLQQLGGDADLSGRHAFLELKLIAKGKIEAK